ncbi:MAG: capsular biosynthesis protein [Hydrogenophilales bacterium]|nr:capsular biosynthesis protein [Hydrogenophilales bacterium]
MIDLHCHFLPKVDDGPECVNVAVAMAEAAVADGIRVSVLTPHVHPRRYDNTRTSLEKIFHAFQHILALKHIPLEVRLGGEVRLSPESLGLILDDNVPFLGTLSGFRVLLLEFPHQNIPVGSEMFIRKLLDLKIRPLIAHPERNKSVMQDPEKIRPYVDMGCWLQLTAGSIAGHFGEQARHTSRYLLEHEWAWIIASDAHNLESRPPKLSEGRDAVAALLGERMARRMVHERPARILGLDSVVAA